MSTHTLTHLPPHARLRHLHLLNLRLCCGAREGPGRGPLTGVSAVGAGSGARSALADRPEGAGGASQAPSGGPARDVAWESASRAGDPQGGKGAGNRYPPSSRLGLRVSSPPSHGSTEPRGGEVPRISGMEGAHGADPSEPKGASLADSSGLAPAEMATDASSVEREEAGLLLAGKTRVDYHPAYTTSGGGARRGPSLGVCAEGAISGSKFDSSSGSEGDESVSQTLSGVAARGGAWEGTPRVCGAQDGGESGHSLGSPLLSVGPLDGPAVAAPHLEGTSRMAEAASILSGKGQAIAEPSGLRVTSPSLGQGGGGGVPFKLA